MARWVYHWPQSKPWANLCVSDNAVLVTKASISLFMSESQNWIIKSSCLTMVIFLRIQVNGLCPTALSSVRMVNKSITNVEKVDHLSQFQVWTKYNVKHGNGSRRLMVHVVTVCDDYYCELFGYFQLLRTPKKSQRVRIKGLIMSMAISETCMCISTWSELISFIFIAFLCGKQRLGTRIPPVVQRFHLRLHGHSLGINGQEIVVKLSFWDDQPTKFNCLIFLANIMGKKRCAQKLRKGTQQLPL